MFIAFEELVFCSEFEIAKSGLRGLVRWLEIDDGFAHLDAKVRRDALRYVHRNLSVAGTAFIRYDNAGDGW